MHLVNPSEHSALRRLEGVSGEWVTLLRDVVRAHPGLGEAQLENFLNRFARDRFLLAVDFLQAARGTTEQGRGNEIMALARAYYVMYQAARVVVFAAKRTDIEDHVKVAANLPRKLPDRGRWQDALKRWRERRNDLDYHVYPQEADLLAEHSSEALGEAGDFLRACKEYLLGRGVTEPPDV
jgi:uncharacterized protein (UPF0332 family)